MFGWLKKLANYLEPASHQPATLPVRRRRADGSFDVAKSTDDHWRAADGLSARTANDPGTRRQLRNRSRYEVANNCHARGITLTAANDEVGCGPQLQVILADAIDDTFRVPIGSEQDEEQVESLWNQWAEEVQLAEKLNTMALSKKIDGEAFALFTTNPKLEHPVKLDISRLECDRVTSPFVNLPEGWNPNWTDGIEYDAYGNPDWYHVLNTHPGDSWSLNPLHVTRIPARNVLHWFREDRPHQARGVPEILAALPLFSQLRRHTLAVLEAAETAASFAAILYTDAMPTGNDGNPVFGAAFEGVEIDKGMLVTAPGGYKLGQLKAEQPTTTHDAFQQSILREIFHVLNMPYSVGSGDFSHDSYSSGRLGLQTYLRIVKQSRHHMKLKVLDRIFRAWLNEAMMLKILPAPVMTAGSMIPHEWHFDPFPSIDPLKDAKADELDLVNGVTTQAELCAERKRDWRRVNRQREREINDQKKRGIYVPPKGAVDPNAAQDAADMGVANAA